MATKLEQAARRALEALKKAEMVYAVRDVHPMAVKQVEDAITALREALDHSADTGKMVVPNGYALVSIDALKAWGKYDEVRNACQFLAEQAEQEPVAEVVLRNQSVGFGRTEERKDIQFLVDVEVGAKLYAAPLAKQDTHATHVVRTKDLTVSELDAIIEKHYDDEMDLKAMILDGIAADREKNK